MKKLRMILIMMLSVFLFWSCTDDDPTSAKETKIPEGFARVTGKIVLPDGVSSSQLKSAKVYLVGNEAEKTYTDKNGNFSILVDVSDESKEMLARKQGYFPKKVLDTKGESNYEYQLIIITENQDNGILVNLGELEAQEVNDIGDTDLLATGTVTGRALLEYQTDHTGIDVYFPGTEFLAKTDSDGKYTINNVPSGIYSHIRSDKSGYIFSAITDVNVTSGTTILSDMTLLLFTGTFGGIEINNGDLYATSLTVSLSIYATSEATLMMISEHDNMFGGVWKPVSAVSSYTFPVAGYKTLFIKFADANGLETAVYYDDITIISDPTTNLYSPLGTTDEISPLFSWGYSQISGTKFHFQLSNNGYFSNLLADVTDLETNYYQYENQLENMHTYYWRVAIIDKNGTQFSWENGQFNFNIGTVTNLEPANNSTVVSIPTLSWTVVENAESYQLQLNDNQNFINPILEKENLTANNYQIDILLNNNTTYYWRVKYTSTDGVVGEWNSPFSFTVNVGVTGLVSPTNEQVLMNNKPLLDWNDANGAQYYEVQVSDNSNFSNIVIQNNTLITSQYQIDYDLNNQTKYYWRVRVINDSILGDWSTVWSFEANTPTEIGGTINSNTTFTSENNPYLVTNNLIVSENVTLTIEPGVKLYFAEAKSMQINGELIARGTESDRILFTGLINEPGSWGSIVFEETAISAQFDDDYNYISGSILEYCDVMYGGENNSSTIETIESVIYINNTHIRYSISKGVSISTESTVVLENSFFQLNHDFALSLYVNNNNVTIKNCEFKNNSQAGVFIGFFGSENLSIEANIYSCSFTENQTAILACPMHGDGSIEIVNNNFYKNFNNSYWSTSSCLMLENPYSSDSPFNKVDINNNIFIENSIGSSIMSVYSENIEVKNNSFIDNNTINNSSEFGNLLDYQVMKYNLKIT
ncbi:MAG: hypothetical protein JXR48_04125 [Candidatus Delongbacteria bacterium]|nr:hypothetical protein [Candidatus Delongbacteria bacterium]MBN2834133.1 hypothetical protein [Candidatus Delongbacteria bacterium]